MIHMLICNESCNMEVVYSCAQISVVHVIQHSGNVLVCKQLVIRLFTKFYPFE